MTCTNTLISSGIYCHSRRTQIWNFLSIFQGSLQVTTVRITTQMTELVYSNACSTHKTTPYTVSWLFNIYSMIISRVFQKLWHDATVVLPGVVGPKWELHNITDHDHDMITLDSAFAGVHFNMIFFFFFWLSSQLLHQVKPLKHLDMRYKCYRYI